MRSAIVITIAAILVAGPAVAKTPKIDINRWMKSFPIRLGSHVLTAKGQTGTASLLLDGKEIEGATRFDMSFAATVDGVPVAAIWADRGGASCYDGAMLLFAVPSGKAVVRGNVDATSCFVMPHVGLANGQVVVVDPSVEHQPADVTPEVAASRGAVWLFDAIHGAVRVMDVAEPRNGEDIR